MRETADGTILICACEQGELSALIGALSNFGFELRSVRRLDARPVIDRSGLATGGSLAGRQRSPVDEDSHLSVW